MIKRVFILGTGRCGTKAVAKACKTVEGWTSGHETITKTCGPDRFDYPEWHIEADNRLSWFLGSLDQRFNDEETLYVLLVRNKKDTINSLLYKDRWLNIHSMIRHFADGILIKYHTHFTLNQGNKDIQNSDAVKLVEFYYETVNNNIRHFLKDKPNTMILQTENLTKQLPALWAAMGAKGNLDKAISILNTKPNNKKVAKTGHWVYNLKLTWQRLNYVLFA